MLAALLVSCARPVPPAAAGVEEPRAERPAHPSDLAWVRQFDGAWYARIGDVADPPPTWTTTPPTTGTQVFRGPAQPVSGEWRSGEVRCTARSSAVIAEEYNDADDVTAPQCGPAGRWVALACDGEPGEVAVPEGVTPPATLSEIPPGDGADRSLAVASDADAIAEAMSEAGEHPGDVTLEMGDVRRFTGGGTFDVVTAAVKTGDDWLCGGEDWFASVTLVVDAGTGSLVASHVETFADPQVIDLHDVERDGVPEVHFGSGLDPRAGVWKAADGSLAAGYEPQSCVCGC
jgi:hypothetical protein